MEGLVDTYIENLTTGCFQKKPHSTTSKDPNVRVTCSTDAIASTSGLSRDAIASTSGLSKHAITTSTIMNESTDTPSDDISICTMDEQMFGTQNTEYLQAEIVQVVTTDEDNSLPEIHVELIKEDKSDEDN